MLEVNEFLGDVAVRRWPDRRIELHVEHYGRHTSDPGASNAVIHFQFAHPPQVYDAHFEFDHDRLEWRVRMNGATSAWQPITEMNLSGTYNHVYAGEPVTVTLDEGHLTNAHFNGAITKPIPREWTEELNRQVEKALHGTTGGTSSPSSDTPTPIKLDPNTGTLLQGLASATHPTSDPNTHKSLPSAQSGSPPPFPIRILDVTLSRDFSYHIVATEQGNYFVSTELGGQRAGKVSLTPPHVEFSSPGPRVVEELLAALTKRAASSAL